MSWWRAKAKNDYGEYEVTFGSKYPERAKAVEKVCKAVIDKLVKTPEDVAVVVRCKDCKHWNKGDFQAGHSIDHMEWGGGCPYAQFARYESDFCSRGERRGDD